MTLSNSWMEKAACAGHPNPDAFFPTSLGRAAHVEAAEALSVCARCPVIAECGAYQRATGSIGVWGSTLVGLKEARTPEEFRSTRARCGTRSGYRKHEMKGETPCHACRVAEASWKAPQGSSKVRRWG